MTQPEYEQLKTRLEEQRRMGMELVERAYETQMRALEMVWTMQAGSGPVTVPGPAPPPPERPRHRMPDEVTRDICAIFPSLPERFSRRDVCAALGYEPDRGALYKALQKLAAQGDFEIEVIGKGQKGTVYRKTDG